jgi:hypothetical protein
MKILGIDLAWNHTGVALVDDDNVIATGEIAVDPKRGRKHVCEADQIERAGLLYDGLNRALAQWGKEADWIAYEFSPWMLAKRGQHNTSNAAVILLAGSLSVMRAALAASWTAPDRVAAVSPRDWQRTLLEGIPVLHDYVAEAERKGFAPQKAKAAAWVKQIYDIWPCSDHEADAICIASYWRDKVMREGI